MILSKQGLKGRQARHTAVDLHLNKAGYTATLITCGWAGAVVEVTGLFGAGNSTHQLFYSMPSLIFSVLLT